MKGPVEPDYSCPMIDSAIEEIEKARKIHDKLREWGKWWQEPYDDLQKEMNTALEEKNDYIDLLKERIVELEKELSYVKLSV
jgi:hypothetical protein